jgi:hypothetical protein
VVFLLLAREQALEKPTCLLFFYNISGLQEKRKFYITNLFNAGSQPTPP